MVATFFQTCPERSRRDGHKPRTANLPHQQIAQNHRQKVKDLLPNRTVGYSPDLARIVGGATTGLFLSQLLFLSDKGHNPDGWVYKSEQEMGRETSLTKREQQTARRKLLALGVIQIERRGWKNTYHFRIVWERLYQVIESQCQQNVATEKVEQEQNVATEPIQNVPTQPPQNVATQSEQNVATQYRNNNRDNNTEETDRENQTIWEKALEHLKKDLPSEEVVARLKGTALLEITDTAARIGVATPFAVAWLERRMYGQICKAMKGVLGKDLDLQFVAAT